MRTMKDHARGLRSKEGGKERYYPLSCNLFFKTLFSILNIWNSDDEKDVDIRPAKRDMTIIRSGRQFVTRSLVQGQIVEMDRSLAPDFHFNTCHAVISPEF